MQELNKAWNELIKAMLKESDNSSDEDMDNFNKYARIINNAVSDFKTDRLMRGN